MDEQPAATAEAPEPKPTGAVTLANVAPLFLAPRH